MSAVEKFEIALEHDIDEQYQYEPGETLRGNVVLDVNQPIKIKAIQVSTLHMYFLWVPLSADLI